MNSQQARHKKLRRAFRDAGYTVMQEGTKYRLCSLPIAWYPGGLLPHTFGSLQAAADYLIPIVNDDTFTAKVRA